MRKILAKHERLKRELEVMEVKLKKLAAQFQRAGSESRRKAPPDTKSERRPLIDSTGAKNKKKALRPSGC
jgi:hypothetical protein